MTSSGDYRVSDKQTETLRSNFLIHWTGKDIQTDYKAFCETQRQEYIHRLRTTLDRDGGGLWMMPVKEKFILDALGPDSPFQYHGVPATCFTEIKLSDTRKHTQRYGCLGFGFTRSFVISQKGEPVQYVSINSPIVRNMRILRDRLEEEKKESLDFNICFLKNMSSCSSRPQKFDNYDEAEWRILLMKDEDEDKKKKQQPNVVFCGNSMRPMAKVKFKPCNLKVLILPDDKTRRQVLNSKDAVGKYILDWLLESHTGLPVIATVEECLQF